DTFADHRVWPARFRDRLAPSLFAATDVRHHHARQPPAQSSEDPVNSHAARHAGQELRESMQPVEPAAVAPPRSAPPSAGASSSTTRDYIGATARVCGHERVYDPSATRPMPPAINEHLLPTYETAQREIALGEACLREARDPVPPDLQRLALR